MPTASTAGSSTPTSWFDSATQIGRVEIPVSAEGTADERTTDPRVSAAFSVVDAFNGRSALAGRSGRHGQRARGTVALATFDTHNSRNLRQEAGNAVAYGMDRDAALAAVTLVPARLWGVADRVGSLETGKDADLGISSGDPFELMTTVEHVFIKGREMPKDTRQRELLERYRDLTPRGR